MSLKMFSEDSKFIAQTNRDVFAIRISRENESINYFLSDTEVKELKALCEYHLQKGSD